MREGRLTEHVHLSLLLLDARVRENCVDHGLGHALEQVAGGQGVGVQVPEWVGQEAGSWRLVRRRGGRAKETLQAGKADE